MTRAKDISKIVTDADLSGTLDVTGAVTAGGLTLAPSQVINLNSGSDSFDDILRNESENATIINARNNVRINLDSNSDSTNAEFVIGYNGTNTTTAKALSVGESGDISFYEDTGTTPKFFWDASAEYLGVGTSSPSATLHLDASGGAFMKIERTGQGYLFLSTDGTNGSIRTSSATGSLKLQTNGNNNRLVITSGGNVGIGTSSPGYKLDVDVTSSALRLNSTTSQALLVISSDDSANAKIEFGDESDNDRGAITYDNPNNAMLFQTNTSERMRIDSSGNVGINTSSPNAKLTSATTDGGSAFSIHRDFSGDVGGSETGTGSFNFTLTDTATSDQIVSRINSVAVAGTGDAFAGSMRFYTAGTNGSIAERMRITSTNVGINTSSPTSGYMLHVGGSSGVHTKVKIEATTATGQAELDLSADPAGVSYINLGDEDSYNIGYLGYFHSDNSMRFQTNSAERVRIDQSGNVGIGGTSFNPKLYVLNNNAGPGLTAANATAVFHGSVDIGKGGCIGFDYGASHTNYPVGLGYVITSQTGSTKGDLAFFTRSVTTDTAPTERMRITSSGNVGIGTSSPSEQLHVSKSSNVNISVETTGSGGGANAGIIIKSVDGGDFLWQTGNATGNALRLYDLNSSAERMRITSAGAMTMGTTSSQTAASGITLKNDVQSGYPTLLFLQNQPGTGGTMGADIHMGYASDYGSILRFYGNPFNARPGGFQFRRVTGSGTSDVSMQIGTDGALNVQGVYDQTTGSGANVNVASDGHLRRSTSSLRYKNTVNDATYGLTELLTLRPVTYKGNNDGDTVFGGLIAEEVHDAGLTEFVQYDDDGEPDALAYGNMVSLCIKAIQELKAELDEAKARITALEGA
jgi:hypothetical protein